RAILPRMTIRRRNLPAMLAAGAAIALGACAHLPGSPGRHGIEVRAEGFTARLDRPRAPLEGAPALLVLPPCLPALAPLAEKVRGAAADAGLIALSVTRGAPEPALGWLLARGAQRIFLLSAGCSPEGALGVQSGGDARGTVLLFPPRAPPASPLPLLVIDRSLDPTSRQIADRWELGCPVAEGASTPGPADEHSLLEAIALWLRARATETTEQPAAW
ncbi:MAG: hypothetical protein ACYCWW_16210, partial [Deltaproteobacteria bacterium]